MDPKGEGGGGGANTAQNRFPAKQRRHRQQKTRHDVTCQHGTSSTWRHRSPFPTERTPNDVTYKESLSALRPLLNGPAPLPLRLTSPVAMGDSTNSALTQTARTPFPAPYRLYSFPLLFLAALYKTLHRGWRGPWRGLLHGGGLFISDGAGLRRVLARNPRIA
jgi:hypothetical protein